MAVGGKAENNPRGPSVLTHREQTEGRAVKYSHRDGLHGSTHHLHIHKPCASTASAPGPQYPQTPAPKLCPIHSHHLEIGLAIEAGCSDITRPVSAA